MAPQVEGKKFIGPKEKLTYMHEDPVDFKDLYVPEKIHLAYYYILYKGFPWQIPI